MRSGLRVAAGVGRPARSSPDAPRWTHKADPGSVFILLVTFPPVVQAEKGRVTFDASSSLLVSKVQGFRGFL